MTSLDRRPVVIEPLPRRAVVGAPGGRTSRSLA